jgi:hypothetical protein
MTHCPSVLHRTSVWTLDVFVGLTKGLRRRMRRFENAQRQLKIFLEEEAAAQEAQPEA